MALGAMTLAIRTGGRQPLAVMFPPAALRVLRCWGVTRPSMVAASQQMVLPLPLKTIES